SESTTTNPITIHPNTGGPQPPTSTESSRTMLRLEDGAVLLTWGNVAGARVYRERTNVCGRARGQADWISDIR
ncbi:hypothetical protein, partial [Micromonospora sp. ALFpr18c]|uniref:hypothetical protein n=1 Tax=Micromonospora sp. ALFpr18c TaxID=1458665 RepID=UPI001CECF6E7